MRTSTIIAGLVGGLDAFYRLVILPSSETGQPNVELRELLLFGAFLVLLGFLGFIPALASIVDVLAYAFVTIIVLNDGFSAIEGLKSL